MNGLKSLLKFTFHNTLHKAERLSFDPTYMYHPKRYLSRYSLKQCYDGTQHCGLMCLLIYDMLISNNIDSKVMKSAIGYGKYLEDHTYIELDNGKIIDPTYKQFMRDNRGTGDRYQSEVYEKLDQYFIGTKEELFDIYNKMFKLGKSVYGNSVNTVDSIECFWEDSQDVSDFLPTWFINEDNEREEKESY